VGVLETMLLMSVNLPPLVRLLAFQPNSVLWNLSITSSQMDFSLNLAPKGNPM